MGARGKLTPARFGRAFFFLLGAGVVFAAPPPSVTPPPLLQTGRPDAAESARILAQFRGSSWSGYIQFDLQELPRRGDTVTYHGRLWGGRDARGAVTRIEVTDGQGRVHRLLLQNGAHPAVWRLVHGRVEEVSGAALFQPLIPGVQVTAFDLQMPYLYWPGGRVERITRVYNRPAYEFVFPAPGAFRAGHAEVTAVRAYFDTQYGAPVRTELLQGGRVLKTTSLVDLKRVEERWIPKAFDVRNDVTRDKTRFEVTGAALTARFGSGLFVPAALAGNVQPPQGVVPVGP